MTEEENSLPPSNESYSSLDYWNERYRNEESYEWCKDYGSVRDLFKSEFGSKSPESLKILVIGCGNSPFSLDLYKDGYSSITNIDYSTVVIEKMALKYSDIMTYTTMDMRHLTFEPNTFDIVIDKSTLDVLFTTEKSMWNISDSTLNQFDLTLNCIKNVLKPSGSFISITFAEPYFRKQLYYKYFNNIKVSSFGDGFHYYFYSCTNLE